MVIDNISKSAEEQLENFNEKKEGDKVNLPGYIESKIRDLERHIAQLGQNFETFRHGFAIDKLSDIGNDLKEVENIFNSLKSSGSELKKCGIEMPILEEETKKALKMALRI